MHDAAISRDRQGQDDPNIEVLPSTHGRGVFACHRLPNDVIVGEIHGSLIRDPDYGSDYCIDVDEGVVLEPSAPFRFLNHSCQPNCEVFMWEADENGDADRFPGKLPRLFLGTTRVVMPGEELTIDYAWPAESAIPCGCGQPTCRGWIVDPDELDEMLDQPEPSHPVLPRGPTDCAGPNSPKA